MRALRIVQVLVHHLIASGVHGGMLIVVGDRGTKKGDEVGPQGEGERRGGN